MLCAEQVLKGKDLVLGRINNAKRPLSLLEVFILRAITREPK
jgi:hypothetical protein